MSAIVRFNMCLAQLAVKRTVSGYGNKLVTLAIYGMLWPHLIQPVKWRGTQKAKSGNNDFLRHSYTHTHVERSCQ